VIHAEIEHLGSAHDEGEVEGLEAPPGSVWVQGQDTLDLGLSTVGVDGEPLEIVASMPSHLWGTLCGAYGILGFPGFPGARGGDEVFRDLVLVQIIEPTSKLDSLRGPRRTGVEPVDSGL
jgi:hypothetical protein